MTMRPTHRGSAGAARAQRGASGPGVPPRRGPFEPRTPRPHFLPGWRRPDMPAEPSPALQPSRVWMTPQVWLAPGEPAGDVYQRLLDRRVVLTHGHLDDEAATRLSAQLLTLDAEGNDPIRIEVQNLTADLVAALTVMGVLDVVGVPLHARVAGRIDGAALGVLAACDERRAYPNAMFGLSEPTVQFGGPVPAILAREAQTRQMIDTLYERLANVTGREVDQVRDDARHGRTLTADEAVHYGLITGPAAPGRRRES